MVMRSMNGVILCLNRHIDVQLLNGYTKIWGGSELETPKFNALCTAN
jgi:hypothetical protein